MNINRMDAIQQVIEDWQEFSTEPLTEEDGREIITNLQDFFAILARWKQEQENGREATAETPPESD